MNNSSNQGNNQQQQEQSSKEMTDKDFLTDIIETEKNMAKNYVIALNEASNDNVFKDIFKVFKDTEDIHRTIFNQMQKKGWYPLEAADQYKTKEKFNEYTNKADELE